MVTSKERGQEVRRKLLTAAAELIAERGWTATTTRVVAERAGVAPGLVHYHFPSIQALLVEAVLQAVSRPAGGDPVEQLLGLLDSEPLSVLLIEAFLAATRDEQLRQALATELGSLRRDLAEHLAGQGVPDPATTAAVFIAALDGVLLHRALLGPADGDTTAVLRRLVTRCA